MVFVGKMLRSPSFNRLNFGQITIKRRNNGKSFNEKSIPYLIENMGLPGKMLRSPSFDRLTFGQITKKARRMGKKAFNRKESLTFWAKN